MNVSASNEDGLTLGQVIRFLVLALTFILSLSQSVHPTVPVSARLNYNWLLESSFKSTYQNVPRLPYRPTVVIFEVFLASHAVSCLS